MSIGAAAVACVVALASIGLVLAQAAPTKTITTTNDFVTGGVNLNGDVGARPFDVPPTGTSDTGSVARVRLLDDQIDEPGDFVPRQNGPTVQGVASVIARGPVVLPPPAAPERSANKYLYMFGGGVGAPLGALDQVYRAEIAADGTLLPPVAVTTLSTARYGAAAAAYGNSIYVIGGYSGSGPISSVEIFNIDSDGNVASAPAGPDCPNSGDLAAVAVNGYLYVIGGVATDRSPVQTNQADVHRAQIQPDGTLSAWAPVDEFLPVPTGGGRAVAVFAPGTSPSATDDVNGPKFRIYYVGGNNNTPPNPENPSGSTSGATTAVWYMSINAYTNEWIDTDAGPTGVWVKPQDGAITLRSGRELFGLTITNGFMYAIGGISRTLTETTLFASVERAPIGPDGVIGQFVDISNPQPRINPGVTGGLGDFAAVSDFDRIWAPFGVDISGNPSDAIWEYDNRPYLLPTTAVSDSSLFDGVIDLGLVGAGDIKNMRFGIDYGTSGQSYFRFRVAQSGGPFYGPSGAQWSNWIDIRTLPLDPDNVSNPQNTNQLHLMQLTYPSGQATTCSPVIWNPSGFQAGELTGIRYIEYQVLLPPDADLTNKFNELTINRLLFTHALPGGFDPSSNPCLNNWAYGDWGPTIQVPGYTARVLRIKGVGFNTLDGTQTVAINKLDPNAPDLTYNPVINIVSPDTIDIILTDIGLPTGILPSYAYSVTISGGNLLDPVTLSPALQLFPPVTVSTEGVDLNPATPERENIVQIKGPGQTEIFSVYGTNFRSGRYTNVGGTGQEDPTSSLGWPDYGPPDPEGQPFFLSNQFPIVCVTDATQAIPYGITLVGANGDGCATVGPKDGGGTAFVSATHLNVQLSFPPTASSGYHELTIRVYNPQINSWNEVVTQTVYVIPYFDVTNVNTQTNTLNPGLVVDNNPDVPVPDWAHARRLDGTGGEVLNVRVYGYNFNSTRGDSLISNVIYNPSDVIAVSFVPPVGPDPNFFYSFDIDSEAPASAKTGSHLVNLRWFYSVTANDNPGVQPPVGPIQSVQYLWTSDTNGDRTAEAQLEKLGVYIDPDPVTITSVLGSFQKDPNEGPIVLMQGDPKLTINGTGFAVQLPIDPTSIIESVWLRGTEPFAADLRATSWTANSDRQLSAYFDIPVDQKPGQLYYLEVNTTLPSTNWWPAQFAPWIIVVQAPQCFRVIRLGSECLYGTPGETFQMEITGANFTYNTIIDPVPGVSFHVDEIYAADGTLVTATNGLLGIRMIVSATVAGDAAGGTYTLVVNNGVAYNYPQTCTLAGEGSQLTIVPAPTVSGIQPGLIQQPSLTDGVKIVTLDIYGTNFTPGTTVSIEGILVNNTIFLSSTHVKAEIVVEANTTAGDYTVVVTSPSGTRCADGPISTGTITIGVKPELFCELVRPAYLNLGDPGYEFTVSGKGLEGFSRLAIGNGNTVIEASSEESSATEVSGILQVPPFAGFDYNLLGPNWNVLLYNEQTGAILNCDDSFAVYAGTVIASVTAPGGEGPPTVCQGSVIDGLVVRGLNFLPNLGPENVDFGPAVQTRRVQVINAGELRVDVSITDSVASIGPHTVTITNPAPDGTQTTLPGAVIVAAVPTVTGISDDTLAQGTEQPITITGSNFIDGTTVSIIPSGVGVFIKPNSTLVVSESQITTTVVSSSSSTLGQYSLVVTAPPPVLGGPALNCSTYTFRNAITNVAAPKIIRIDPSTIGAGMQNVNVTITGSGFQPGAQVFIGEHGSGGDPESEDYVSFCEGGSMIYVRPGGGFIDPTRIVVCLNVDEFAPPMMIPVEVVNPDRGTAVAPDKLSISVPNQPTPPSDLSAELFPNGKVTLTFQDNASNETGFVVERSLNGGAWTVAKNIKALRGIGTITCNLTGLKPGNVYDFRVKAVNKSNGNIASPAALLNLPVEVDSKITGKPVINLLEFTTDVRKSIFEGVVIEWSAPTGEVRSYSILRSTKGGPWVSVGAVDGGQTIFFDTDIVTGTKYGYKIEARNNFNTKVSNSKNITP